MNQEQLNAIKERALNATDGPWQVYEMEDGTHIGTAEHHPQLKSPMHVVTMIYWGDKPHSRVFIDKDNAEFIKHAITDVPALVAEVEYLREMLRDTRKIVRRKVREVKTLQNACKKHKAKQEALEFQLKVSIMHAEELDEELEAEVAENEQLREALEFYANGNSYFVVDMYDESVIMRDKGDKARRALSGEADE